MLILIFQFFFRPKFEPNGEKIALFENVLQETLQNGQRMFIDIKAKGNEVVKVVLDAFKKHPELYEKAVISSFNPVTIYMVINLYKYFIEYNYSHIHFKY